MVKRFPERFPSERCSGTYSKLPRLIWRSLGLSSAARLAVMLRTVTRCVVTARLSFVPANPKERLGRWSSRDSNPSASCVSRFSLRSANCKYSAPGPSPGSLPSSTGAGGASPAAATTATAGGERVGSHAKASEAALRSTFVFFFSSKARGSLDCAGSNAAGGSICRSSPWSCGGCCCSVAPSSTLSSPPTSQPISLMMTSSRGCKTAVLPIASSKPPSSLCCSISIGMPSAALARGLSYSGSFRVGHSERQCPGMPHLWHTYPTRGPPCENTIPRPPRPAGPAGPIPLPRPRPLCHADRPHVACESCNIA
mmetsp:Transcript_24134/g.78627  ORF Transcript_24134/g.78627 Transcript_24134/m.78627 type:complete len:311 (+) Transcript_24134:1203-2135(+)